MSRLALLALVSVCIGLTQGCATHVSSESSVRLLHTNDTHGSLAGGDESLRPCIRPEACYGGYGRIARAIRSIKEKDPGAYAVDAGDLWQGSLYFRVAKAAFAKDVAVAMPWDAATAGNHEFDLGCAALREYLEVTPAPLLMSNVAPDRECPLHGARYDTIRVVEINGARVGFFGLVNDNVRANSSACEQTRFLDRYEAAERAVKQLSSQGVDRIVAITHIGYGLDLELARRVRGIDVIIGGHSHTLLGTSHPKRSGPYPTVVESPNGEKTLVATAFFGGRLLGDLNVTFDDQGRVMDWSGRLHDLHPDYPSDPKIDDVLTDYLPLVTGHMAEPLAENPKIESEDPTACRTAVCTSGAVLVDAYAEFGRRYGASVALINGGAVRYRLPTGVITRGDVMQSYPYDDQPVIFEVTGKAIRTLLENGAAGRSPRFVQTAGLRYCVDLSQRSGQRIVDIDIGDDANGWTDLEESSVYRIVVSTYMARGRGEFAPLAGLDPVLVGDVSETDMISDHLKRLGRLPDYGNDRIVVIRK